MAEQVSAQERLDKIVVLIAANMVAEVCSVYVLRVDGNLELYATEGLNRGAVRNLVFPQDGLVGFVSSKATPLNLSDALSHPAFSFRPETGEEIYHAFIAVPILRAGNTLGVLTVQNRAKRTYVEEELEALQITAMVIAEMISSGELSTFERPAVEGQRSLLVTGVALNKGVATGRAVLHAPRFVVPNYVTKDMPQEIRRLNTAVTAVRTDLDAMLERDEITKNEILRTIVNKYRKSAYDDDWTHKLTEAVATGLTAEAAIERVNSDTMARIRLNNDPLEHQSDFKDIPNRLLRHLVGDENAFIKANMPERTVLVANSIGPTALLDYDRDKIKGLILEESRVHSDLATVARALKIPAVTEIKGATNLIVRGDPITIDGGLGEIKIRLPREGRFDEGAQLQSPSAPPELPEQGPGPHFMLRDDGVVDFAPPAAIDSLGNNIPHLRALHPLMRDLARNLVETLGHGNVPHSTLHERAQSYFALIDQEIDEISFAQLYVEGVRLENASKSANEKIAEKELPSLNTSAREELETLLTLHGTFILSTADGLALLGAEERYKRRPHEEVELRETILEFAKELKKRPDIMSPNAATFVANSAEELAQGKHPERSAIAAVSTTRNAAIVIVSGAALSAIPVVGGLMVGAPGLIGGGVVAFIGAEGLKKAKSFLAISGLVTKGLDQLSEADLQRIVSANARELTPYIRFILKIEPTLRRLANRDQFNWLSTSLDWLRKHFDRNNDS
jgi:phosphohistidine swiveling domain-containing protein